MLPALGEVDATQSTIAELAERSLREVNPKWSIRGEEPASVATLKGDARLAEVLSRALWSHVTMPTEGLVVPRGARRWRVATYEVEELVDSLRGAACGTARRARWCPRRWPTGSWCGWSSPATRPTTACRTPSPAASRSRTTPTALWPAVDPARLVWRLLSDAGVPGLGGRGLLSEDEQASLLWVKPPKSPASTPWTLAEAILVDEAADLVERTGSVGHIVADEAQDLSPMMLRALARRSSTGSLTVLGDLAQATTPWATRSWAEALAHLGKPDAHVEQLTRGFRVPGEVIEYAARLLPVIAPGLEPPTSVRRSRGELEVVPLASVVDVGLGRHHPRGFDRADRAGRAGRRRAARPDGGRGPLRRGGPGVGGSDEVETEFDQHLDLVPASLAKGLEFDHVVLLEPAAIVAGEPDRMTGLRRLYVCLTRAVTSLVVAHAEPLPPELGDLHG